MNILLTLSLIVAVTADVSHILPTNQYLPARNDGSYTETGPVSVGPIIPSIPSTTTVEVSPPVVSIAPQITTTQPSVPFLPELPQLPSYIQFPQFPYNIFGGSGYPSIPQLPTFPSLPSFPQFPSGFYNFFPAQGIRYNGYGSNPSYVTASGLQPVKTFYKNPYASYPQAAYYTGGSIQAVPGHSLEADGYRYKSP